MSLINDALRRAKQVQEQAPAPPPAHPLSPVEPDHYMVRGAGVFFPVAMTAVALLGLFLVWQLYQRNHSNPNAQPVAHEALSPRVREIVQEVPPATATLSEKSAPTITSNPNPGTNLSRPAVTAIGQFSAQTAANPGPSAAGAVGLTTTNPVAASAESLGTNTAVASQPEPPKPPPLTLQGVVYNPKRPSVLINGKTLFLGDRIGQFRVAAIHPDSATLIGPGRTNLLSLEQ